jgi:hypothetical protein
VASSIAEGEDYRIKITWISASNDPNNSDESDKNFNITLAQQTTTTTTTESTIIYSKAIGIDYNNIDNMVSIVLGNGFLALFEIDSYLMYGLIDLLQSGVTCMKVKSYEINSIDKQTKVRVFVGSEPLLSDKWDSGEIETELTSIYYGNGNNLQSGVNYYVNIQIFTRDKGWGDVQTAVFQMIN